MKENGRKLNKAEDPTLELKSLDVKGREIFGLKPKMESFSRLEKGKDVEIIKKNNNIVSNVDLDSAFIFINPTGGTEEHLVEPPHWRSVSQDIKASLDTKNGVEYYYKANTKGCGYLKPTLKGGHNLDEYPEWKRIDELDYEGAYGLVDKHSDEFIFKDNSDIVSKTKWFADMGLRAELFYAVGDLKNIYYQGKSVSVDRLIDQGVIYKDLIPQIGIRLVKINTRIAEVSDSDEKRAKELFKQAFEAFNQEAKDKKLQFPEIKIGDADSEKLYFQIFFERMGKNMAIFQNIGYTGWSLHSANITLAAEIVDTGSYDSWKADMDDDDVVRKYSGVRRGVLKDMRDIAYGLRSLIEAGESVGMGIPERNFLVSEFLRSFDSALEHEMIKKEDANVDELKSAFSKIIRAVIVENKRLPAIKHGYDIEDWELNL